LADRLDDPELLEMADAVKRRADALARLGEKASTVDSVLAAGDPVTVDVREEVDAVVTAAHEREPNARIECVVDDSVTTTIHARRDAVRAILENTVENALDHHDGEGTARDDGGVWAQVTLRNATTDAGDDQADLVIVVEDDGPGIPDHEVAPIESGRETALEHGSGLGLWVIEWSASILGATVTYTDRTPRGTRVTVRVPTTAVSRSGSEAPT
jgi:signal transduction histidine kinase